MNKEMKKILNSLFLIPVLALALAGCSVEEIVFDHEKPAFDTRAGQVLIEAILPTSTAADDEIYIAGPFAGDSAYVVGKTQYRLTHSDKIPAKWGIYIDPSSYRNNKTLADGFYFVSIAQGIERSVKNADILHSIEAVPGERYNVYADRWRAYFNRQEDGEEETLPEHEGTYRIYVKNTVGWASMNMYMYGDVNDLGGGWPGIPSGGVETISGVEYLYFDVAVDEASGKTEHLIFNNGEGEQIEGSAEPVVTYGDKMDYFFDLVDKATVNEIDNPIQPVLPEHEGTYRVYVLNTIGWAAMNMYMYGDVNDLGGGWPGIPSGGVETIGGVEYLYFDVAVDEASGKTEHLIFNNGEGEQIEGTAEPVVTYGDKMDLFFEVIAKNDVKNLDEEDTPEPEPITYDGPKVYIQNKTLWPGNLYAHYWGDGFGTDWPGTQITETATIGGVEYLVLPILTDAAGKEAGIIFHSDENDGENRVETKVTFDTDRFYVLETSGLTEVEAGIRIIVKDETLWPGNIFAHIWNDDYSTEWPGIAATNGFFGEGTYRVFLVPSTLKDQVVNVIFHSDENDGENRYQTTVTLDKDRIYILGREFTFKEKEEDPEPEVPVDLAKIYIQDKTSWPGNFFAHMWTDDGYSTTWPGLGCTEETVGGVAFKVIETEEAVQGQTVNVIFHSDENDGDNRVQTTVTLDKTRYYELTTEGLTEISAPVAASNAKFYIEDKTSWPGNFFAHFWNSDGYSTTWPGIAATEETVGGVAYKVIETEASVQGQTLDVIFHSDENDGENRVQTTVTADVNHYYVLTTEGLTEKVKIYIEDNTSWPGNFFAHFWNDEGYSTTWPGIEAVTEVVDGVSYKVIVTDPTVAGQTVNVIFHSDENDGDNRYQTTVNLDKARFYTLTSSALTEK